MSPVRTAATVLAAAALIAPAVAFGQGAGGAGDDQYADPLAGAGSTPAATKTSTTSSKGSTGSNGLSKQPNLGIDNGTTQTPPNSGSTGSGTSSTPSTGLPNTGSDPRLIILAGLSLLLAGTGLRLRTADEDF